MNEAKEILERNLKVFEDEYIYGSGDIRKKISTHEFKLEEYTLYTAFLTCKNCGFRLHMQLNPADADRILAGLDNLLTCEEEVIKDIIE